MKILSVVEATNVNAVAKLVLDFYRTADEVSRAQDNLPTIKGSIVTFDRAASAHLRTTSLHAVHAAGIDLDIIPERGPFDLSVIPALKNVASKRQPEIIRHQFSEVAFRHVALAPVEEISMDCIPSRLHDDRSQDAPLQSLRSLLASESGPCRHRVRRIRAGTDDRRAGPSGETAGAAQLDSSGAAGGC
jgi:hypothetical protein